MYLLQSHLRLLPELLLSQNLRLHNRLSLIHISAGKEYSLAELHLETGRTHQIRVHMKYIGHPLPGDYLYNPDYRRINRQPLHSYQLEFTHPTTGKVMLFTAPLPIDFISAFYSNPLK